jgi:hypothetical protein
MARTHGSNAISDEDFTRLFGALGPARLARRLGQNIRSVYARRKRLENRMGHSLPGPNTAHAYRFEPDHHPHRLAANLRNGVILVGSDAHYWPGLISTAHRAFVYFCRELQPTIVVKNGDEIDAPSIGRHPPIGWEYRPTLISEIEAAQERQEEILDACRRKTRLWWPIGNHDARFNTRLALQAPEYAKIHGVHLKDHFPRWEPCWSAWVNGHVVIKHRWMGGAHATYNNTIRSGKTIVTGHLHSLKVNPFSDYNGTRWGCDSGTMACPWGPQFVNYTEDNSKDWRSGFLVLTFVDGELLWPEIVRVLSEKDRTVDFRGKIYRV